ncbi:MAG: DUF167 domain-containing protein [Candidatus Ratteibacteria bacterium]|jgi:uncharacterized protein YggU (UPF0235/DUF167 family)
MKIFVKVKTRARHEKIEKTDKNHYTVWVKEIPEKGRANAAVILLLSKHFSLPKKNIKLLSGASSSTKLFELFKGDS